MTPYIIASAVIFAALVIIFVWYQIDKSRRALDKHAKQAELQKKSIETLAQYVAAQKEEAEQRQKVKELRAAEQREKLETFKRTKDELKDRLRAQIDAKEWTPLSSILKKIDKGVTGIYILYNETKDKYYVGQSKELFARIRKHFEVEQIALDFINGDTIKVKTLTAGELDADYRIDHIEKTGIEIFNAAANGYNKTSGNL